MLKFIKHHLDTIAGVGIYPVISFVLFFSFFLAVLWWLRSVSKRHITHMSELPFAEDALTAGSTAVRDPAGLRSVMALLAITSMHALFAQGSAGAPPPADHLVHVDGSTLYTLLALAVVQAIFIMAMAGIMRTMSGPGALAQWLIVNAGRTGKAGVLIPFLLLLSLEADAQAYQVPSDKVDNYWVFWALIAVNLFLFVLMIAQIVLLRSMTRALVADNVKEEVVLVKGPSWAERMLQRLTRQVAIEKEKDVLMHHEYDGIRELDNALPPWWVWLFYGTIIWSVVYVVNVHVIDVWPHQAREYNEEMAQAKLDVAAYMATLTNTVDENTVALSAEAGVLALGKNIFSQYCTPCHGADGAGSETSVGPNLTDAHWIHGGGVKNVFKIIKYGVPEKGMISWKAQLKPAEMAALANYILSLEGSGPATQKAPQGDVWTDGAAPADSTMTTSDSIAITPTDTARMAVVQ